MTLISPISCFCIKEPRSYRVENSYFRQPNHSPFYRQLATLLFAKSCIGDINGGIHRPNGIAAKREVSTSHQLCQLAFKGAHFY